MRILDNILNFPLPDYLTHPALDLLGRRQAQHTVLMVMLALCALNFQAYVEQVLGAYRDSRASSNIMESIDRHHIGMAIICR